MTTQTFTTNADPSQIIAQLTLDEKISMLSGAPHFWQGMKALMQEDSYHNEPFVAARCERLGLDGVSFIDGPRGIVIHGGATCFPVSMARGASWNAELEQQIGDAIGKELRALGGNLFGGVCINLLRHPAWGRAQETYGEDPVHVGAMGSGLVLGVERHGLACIKHFAANSIENARFKVDVTLSDQALHEVYLPHFKACVDAGATVVMSAYNAVNGEWCGQNKTLLTEILRDQWNFDGFVLTDFIFGMRDAKTAIDAGLDLEMPFEMVWGAALKKLVENDEVREAQLDQALERIIAAQLRLPPAQDYPKAVVGAAAHKALAREAAVQSMVLLKNEGRALPLAKEVNLVVLGQLAAEKNLGDRGSSDGRPDYVVTPLDGLKAASGGSVQHFADLSIDGAKEAVKAADAVALVVGYTHEDEGEFIAPASDLAAFAPLMPPPPKIRWLFNNSMMRPVWQRLVKTLVKLTGAKQRKIIDEGEATFGKGGDRTRLELRAADEALIQAACTLNANVNVAIMAGSAVLMENWRAAPQSIMMMWYPGMEGGHAFADLIYGDRSPSGRLPFSIPRSADHLPHFDKDAVAITYDEWHGYRKLERDGNPPAFPFGFGLSYTEFEHSDLACVGHSKGDNAPLQFEVVVRNAGQCAGEEVLQLYAKLPSDSEAGEPRRLVGFSKVELQPGEAKKVQLSVPLERLKTFDCKLGELAMQSGNYHFEAVRHGGDHKGQSVKLEL